MLRAIEADVVNRGLQDFKEQEISNLVWGFAKVSSRRWHEPRNSMWCSYAVSLQSGAGGQLIQNVGDEMRRRGKEAWLPQHLANIAWACATRYALLRMVIGHKDCPQK